MLLVLGLKKKFKIKSKLKFEFNIHVFFLQLKNIINFNKGLTRLKILVSSLFLTNVNLETLHKLKIIIFSLFLFFNSCFHQVNFLKVHSLLYNFKFSLKSYYQNLIVYLIFFLFLVFLILQFFHYFILDFFFMQNWNLK